MNNEKVPPPAYSYPIPSENEDVPPAAYSVQSYMNPIEIKPINDGINSNHQMGEKIPKSSVINEKPPIVYPAQHIYVQHQQYDHQQPAQIVPQHYMIDMSRNPNVVRGVTAVNQPQEDYQSLIILSLFGCLCCFCPTGIIAMYYACRANDYHKSGQYDQAQRDKTIANNWIKVTVFIGILLLIWMTFG